MRAAASREAALSSLVGGIKEELRSVSGVLDGGVVASASSFFSCASVATIHIHTSLRPLSLASGIELWRSVRSLAALPLTLGVADGSGRVWGCCAQLAEAVGAS